MNKMKDTLFILFQHLVPQHLLSRFVGKLASSTTPWIKNSFIRWFCNNYDIHMSEAQEEEPTNYPSFNAFFTRALKPDARPVDQTKDSIVSPADGAISQLGKIEHGRIFQAKGQGYGLTTLLGGDTERAKPFIDGQFATIYLSPRDYHRVHMPVTGKLTHGTYIPGDLYSVNQTTAEGVDQLFARNERYVAFFETEQGPMAMVLVGAMIVAGIETVWSGQEAPAVRKPINTSYQATPDREIILNKGDEMGRFMLGSTVILLFPDKTMNWLEELQAGSPVKLGEKVAQHIAEHND